MSHSVIESELVLAELVEQLRLATGLARRAFRNLGDALPGFPPSTPGASPSAGQPEVDDGGVVPFTPVERVALGHDDARAALARLQRLIDGLRPAVGEVYSLTVQWGYDLNQAKLDLVEGAADGWCECCLRIQVNEPINTKYYARTCRWCGDFRTAEGHSPSADLLLAHHDGRRITRTMIDADRSRTRKPQLRR